MGARVVSSDGRAQAVTDINGFCNLAVTQTTSLSYQNIGYSTQTMAISSHVERGPGRPRRDGRRGSGRR